MTPYKFSEKFEARFQDLEKKFPKRSSLVLWALHLAQEDIGYISPAAVDYVAGRVGVSPAWVKGVVSFYSMFREKPIGKYHPSKGYGAESCGGGIEGRRRGLAEALAGPSAIRPYRFAAFPTLRPSSRRRPGSMTTVGAGWGAAAVHGPRPSPGRRLGAG